MPEPLKKRRRFRWIRRAALGLTVLLAGLVAVGITALNHLDFVAKWSLERVFPGIAVSMKSLRVTSPTQIEASDLEFRSARTGELLLKLEAGAAVFSLNAVFLGRIEEVRLTNPDLRVSPDLDDALGIRPAKPGETPSKGGGFSWSIGRIVAENGSLVVQRFGERAPEVSLKFSVDLADFGVTGDAAEVLHEARLRDIRAVLPGKKNDPLLELSEANIAFTTEGLFDRKRIESVKVGAGRLAIGREFAGDSGGTGHSAPSTPGWTVGALDIAKLEVGIADLPAPLHSAAFGISTTLRNLGARGSTEADVEQDVRVTDLVVRERDEEAPALTANSAKIRFTVEELIERHVRELDLENPTIRIGPGAINRNNTEASSKPDARAATGEPAVEWLVDRATCRYGTIEISGLGNKVPDATTRFTFELTGLGTTPEALANEHRVVIWDTRVSAPKQDSSPFLTLDAASIRFTTQGLLRDRRIERLLIRGGRFIVGKSLEEMLAAPEDAQPAQPAAVPGKGWTLGTLDVKRVRTRLDDERPDVTDIFFTINTKLENVPLTVAAGEIFDEVKTIEFADVEIRSPVDRTAKILSLRSVFVRFTINDLVRKKVREIVILRPTIFLNQDLFIYMERATAAPDGAAPAQATAGPNWSVDRLDVKFGRLVIGSGGTGDVGLPLEFETTVENVAFDNLASLRLQAELKIPRQSYSFDSYQVGLDDVEGNLRFAYPPEKGANNLVQKLSIREIRWRQYQARKSWISVTFDLTGINGLFGGEAYGGYLNGGFSFFFQNESPWIGWIAGTAVNTAKVTDVASPQNFRMTGPLDFDVQLDAFSKNIDRVSGRFAVTKPGRFTIGKLDDLIAEIPDAWPALKRSSTRIALETLRDFDYTNAKGDLWFVQSQGILNLNLAGPNGSRNFEVVLHAEDEKESLWQKGKMGSR